MTISHPTLPQTLGPPTFVLTEIRARQLGHLIVGVIGARVERLQQVPLRRLPQSHVADDVATGRHHQIRILAHDHARRIHRAVAEQCAHLRRRRLLVPVVHAGRHPGQVLRLEHLQRALADVTEAAAQAD